MASATVKHLTASGDTGFKYLSAIVVHATTLAATDTVTFTKGNGGAVGFTFEPSANNGTIHAGFPVAAAAGRPGDATTWWVSFNGTFAGDVGVVGY